MMRHEIAPGYYVNHYGKGEPCEKGETAAKSGCVPASGEKPQRSEALTRALESIASMDVSEMKELQATLRAQLKEKTPKKEKSPEVVPSLDEGQISAGVEIVGQMQDAARSLDEMFFDPGNGPEVVERLRSMVDDAVASAKTPEQAIANRLQGIIDIGGLQSIGDGKFWRRENLSDFSPRLESKNALKDANLSVEQLQSVTRILRVGMPVGRDKKNKKKLEDNLIKGIERRAFHR